MSADIFIAGLAGLSIIGVLIFALTSAKNRDGNIR
ncbi:hypothetical protein C357_02441 [Citreicella sp. 357]|nr:hypothetical protein C357_02441 [Citreicella sp. 357]